MCGLSCFVHRYTNDSVAFDLEKSLNRITHRGHAKSLYEVDYWENVGLGCHRLPFTSGNEKQPVSSKSGRYHVLLNGELYNFHSVAGRANLESDTKQFADSLEERGIESLAELDGMFAVVVLDTQLRKLHFSRDRLGIKPLYYSVSEEALILSSEIKGISHFSKFHDIRHVQPGAVWTLDLESFELTDSKFAVSSPVEFDLNDYPGALLAALRRSVVNCTSDRKSYGIFLSGGIDSSLIYALMHEAGVDVVPIVLGSQSASDRKEAAALCARYGQDPYRILCPPEDDLFRTIHTTIRAVESFEPNLVRQSSLSTLLGHGAQAMGLDVVLCGEGADELFGGYPELVRSNDFVNERLSFLADLHRTQLQRVDRTAMDHTVEVRVPFLNNEIIDLALAREFEAHQVAPNAPEGKRSKVLLRYAARNVLDERIRWRKKVVLSEGAGLRGNHPTTGMFTEIFNTSIPNGDLEVGADEIAEWSLNSLEEIFYFKIFKQFGYSKYSDAKKRVHANAIHTIAR